MFWAVLSKVIMRHHIKFHIHLIPGMQVQHVSPYKVWEWDASAIDGEDEANV